MVDGAGKIIREQRIASEPEALIAWFRGLGFGLERMGLEAGPMSQWLYAASLSDTQLDAVKNAARTMPPARILWLQATCSHGHRI